MAARRGNTRAGNCERARRPTPHQSSSPCSAQASTACHRPEWCTWGKLRAHKQWGGVGGHGWARGWRVHGGGRAAAGGATPPPPPARASRQIGESARTLVHCQHSTGAQQQRQRENWGAGHGVAQHSLRMRAQRTGVCALAGSPVSWGGDKHRAEVFSPQNSKTRGSAPNRVRGAGPPAHPRAVACTGGQ